VQWRGRVRVSQSVTLYCADCSSAPHEGLNRPSAGRRQSDRGTTRTVVLCPSAAQRPNGYSDSGGAFVRTLRHRTRALRGPCRCARSNLWCWCAARHGVDLPLLQVEDVPALRPEPLCAQYRNRYPIAIFGTLIAIICTLVVIVCTLVAIIGTIIAIIGTPCCHNAHNTETGAYARSIAPRPGGLPSRAALPLSPQHTRRASRYPRCASRAQHRPPPSV
jgi:hypothetical protein